jgi:hypothetical protein
MKGVYLSKDKIHFSVLIPKTLGKNLKAGSKSYPKEGRVRYKISLHKKAPGGA